MSFLSSGQFSNRANLGTTFTGGSLTTTTFTSVTNCYYLLAVCTVSGTLSSVSGTSGLSPTLIDSTVNGSSNLYLYGCLCTAGSSTASFTLTVSGFVSYSVDEVAGCATTGTIAQHSKAAAKTLSITPLAGTNLSYVVGTCGSAGMTPKTGWAQLFYTATSAFLLTECVNRTEPTQAFTTSDTVPAIIYAEIAMPTYAGGGAHPSKDSLQTLGVGV